MYTKGNFRDGHTGWKAVKYPEGRGIGFSTHEIHWSDYGECVAEIVHGEHNANLIAAAPELFEALEEIVHWVKQGDYEVEFLEKSIKALNRATGNVS
jgi:hypothetical protein